MKKLMLAFLLLVGLQNYAQEVSTSLEEYNYLTAGYPESIEKGLDFKKGYELQEFGKVDQNDFKLTFYKFINQETNQTKAILIKLDRPKTMFKKGTHYICLPINNETLFNRFLLENNSGTDSWFKFYNACLKMLTKVVAG